MTPETIMEVLRTILLYEVPVALVGDESRLDPILRDRCHPASSPEELLIIAQLVCENRPVMICVKDASKLDQALMDKMVVFRIPC